MSTSAKTLVCSSLLLAALTVPSPTFAGPPELDLHGPEDDHVRPELYNQQNLPQELMPAPSKNAAEYPLALWNPADPSNYTVNGITSYDYIVVHTMQGYYLGAQSWFRNPSANVSAHFCMQSSDGEVTQMVHLSDRAWHVGSSNSVAIGIEHEGYVDDPAWYTWEMYRSSAVLSRWLADELEIPLDRNHIVGHVELPNQTHTDPGPNWDWDLYMALILDLVSGGEVEGYVVDLSATCTITATTDTWIKATLESSADLDDTQKCSITTGTEIEYLHASGDMVGHRRLSYEAAGGPCEGFIGLDSSGFIFADHFTATCDPASMGAAGVTVVLNGGAQTTTDANGYFGFANVAPGAHSVDVLGGSAYYDTMVPVDLDVHPGTRVVIGVDPVASGDGDGDPGTGDGDGGECWIGAEGCPCTDGGGCDPGLICDSNNMCVPDGDTSSDDGTGETNGSADGSGIDYLEADGCSVTGANPRGGLVGLALLGLLGLVRRRRP